MLRLCLLYHQNFRGGGFMKSQKLLTAAVALLMTPLVYGYGTGKTVLVEDRDEGTRTVVLQTSNRDRLFWGADVFWHNESPHRKHVHLKNENMYYGARVGYDLLTVNSPYFGIEGLYALGKVRINAQSHEV